MTTSIQDILKNLNLESLGQNLASTQTFAQELVANDDCSLDFENYEEYILDLLALMQDDVRSRNRLVRNLMRIKNLIRLELPLKIRPTVFRQINSLSGMVMMVHTRDQEIYNHCHQILTMIKTYIDEEEQTCNALNEIEWEELQKTFYLLTDWEDFLKAEVFTTTTPNAMPELRLIRE